MFVLSLEAEIQLLDKHVLLFIHNIKLLFLPYYYNNKLTANLFKIKVVGN